MSDKIQFEIGDTVRKLRGSQWHGTIVGTYSTDLTPKGYAVESATEKGSVQIYPASALELWQPAHVAVPDGWKPVPVRATREQVNAVCMHPDLARTLYRSMVEAAPAPPAAEHPDTVKVRRELLGRYFDALDRLDSEGPVRAMLFASETVDSIEAELRALLAGGEA